MLNWAWLWRNVRGGLIALTLLFGILSGIPETSARQRELLSPPLRAARELLDGIQSAVLAPVRFVPSLFQFSQHWKLFSSASDARFRMWIEARTATDSEWQVLYRPHDPGHRWMEDELEYRRVRGNWNPSRKGPSHGYDEFVTWLARRIFLRAPAYVSVRVRMEEIELLEQGRGFAAKGAFLHERLRHRNEVLP